ncbi:invasion associated locus B family protein [Roseibium aestuarii]|uniref:Invasion associated locus B family protein n=1 Tax=Roseibium aestuarii TaxID=2600299 RepID=A0ABW4JWA5_9HYPH|nr:invasion associated locus B family protein [Roseibium aestuarii]
MMQAKTLMAGLLGLLVSGAAASAQDAKLLEKHKDWFAFAHAGSNGKVCYALSVPTKMLPGDRNHGDVFFFVSTRPGEGVKEEPSFLVGYPFKDGAPVVVDVDGKKFNMFSKNDGAWIDNAATEAQLIAAMKAGREMNVEGESQRGTKTSYAFSLSGITAAITTAENACK